MLQRLDEDEAAVLSSPAGEVRRRREPGSVPWDRMRILAECELKRRLMLGEGDCEESDLLRLLGLPYERHPDYSDAWRPRYP